MSLTAECGNETFDKIIAHMLEAYARGAEIAKIYTGDEFAFNAVTKWSKGWIRKAGPKGVWKNSKGMFNDAKTGFRLKYTLRPTYRSSGKNPNPTRTTKKNTSTVVSGQERNRTKSALW